MLVTGAWVAGATLIGGQGEETRLAGSVTATAAVSTTSPASGMPEFRGPARALRGERTHPRLRPTVGGPHARFILTFTLREAPGHHGVLAVAYRVQLAPPLRARASCRPAELPTIDTGAAGAIERVPLRPPRHGWCKGAYRVTVFLERGPYCPPPVAGKAPIPCPEFALQAMDTGEASFTVRPRAHRRG
jgi:hypothetical protein